MTRWRLVLAALLAVVIFILDTYTVLGVAIAVMYVLPLLIVGVDDQQPRITPWSLSCAGLSVASFLISHGGSGASDFNALVRMLMSLGANAATTWLIMRGQQTFRTLRISETRYRTIFDTLAVAIWEFDFRPVQEAIEEVRSKGVVDLRRYIAENPEFVIEARRLVRITDVNDTAVKMMQVRSKRAFNYLGEFLPDSDETFADCVIAIDERHPVFQAETSVRLHDGGTLDIIVALGFAGTGPLDRVPGSILDVTERNRLSQVVVSTRAQLDRAQRAGALGQMTASIAHEVNQPLSAVRSFADAAARWLQRDPPNLVEATAAIGKVIEAADTADQVVLRVRSLVNKTKKISDTLRLDTVVRDAAGLLQREIAEHRAKLTLELEAGDAEIQGDRILLQQVLVNLIINALHAMTEHCADDPVVTVTTRIVGNDILVRVADQGPGWGHNIGDRAFEPFQTTKADGLGLGLAICRAAIEVHGGEIGLSDAPSGGAVIQFSLPMLEKPDGLTTTSPAPRITSMRALPV